MHLGGAMLSPSTPARIVMMTYYLFFGGIAFGEPNRDDGEKPMSMKLFLGISYRYHRVRHGEIVISLPI